MYPSRSSQGGSTPQFAKPWSKGHADRVSTAQQVRFTYNIGMVCRILDWVCRILEGVHRILDGICRILDGLCRILEARGVARWLAPHTHSSCRKTRRALARRNARDAGVAEEAGKAVWEGWQGGWGCGPGGPGGVAGRVVARSGGW